MPAARPWFCIRHCALLTRSSRKSSSVLDGKFSDRNPLVVHRPFSPSRNALMETTTQPTTQTRPVKALSARRDAVQSNKPSAAEAPGVEKQSPRADVSSDEPESRGLLGGLTSSTWPVEATMGT